MNQARFNLHCLPGASPWVHIGAAAVLVLSALPSMAQTTGTTQPAAATGPANAPAGSGGAGRSQPQTNQRVGDDAQEWIEDMAHAHLAEIETGKLALEKSQNAQVRQFAQQMVTDHTTALQELQKLAQSKNLKTPDETDFQHKAIAAALRLLSGETFDRQYVRHVGVNDHRRTLEMVQQVAREARDPDLKAHATKMAPIIQKHLGMARQLAPQR